LEKGNGQCTGVENKTCKGACIKQESRRSYNKRVKKAIDEMSDDSSYAIVDKGLEETELSCILVDNGKFFGMGYLPSEFNLSNIDDIKEYLTSYREITIFETGLPVIKKNSLLRSLILSGEIIKTETTNL
jgi:DNA polymerase-3 subunit epsilon